MDSVRSTRAVVLAMALTNISSSEITVRPGTNVISTWRGVADPTGPAQRAKPQLLVGVGLYHTNVLQCVGT